MDNSKEVLRLSTNELFPETEIPDLSFGIETYGVFRPCTQASSRGFEDCQLIHTGRFLQQRFINNLPGLFGYELLQSGLDIVAWPDRLSLLLRMSLAANSPRDGRDAFVVRFSVPAAYQAVPAEGGLKVFRHPVTGNGGNWRMTHREATGNRITVAAQRGTVEKHYPIVIAAENDEAHFTVAGGMGYVPLTVTG
ncbi:MAG: hypothetical protein LBG28_11880, partial [Tannerella sp.]|nr:hypothetical protein [Tannerella sp.]